jgi:hypothetical protein
MTGSKVNTDASRLESRRTVGAVMLHVTCPCRNSNPSSASSAVEYVDHCDDL